MKRLFIRTKYPPRRPKRPETTERAPQKRASGRNFRHDGPNDQKAERVYRRRAHQDQIPRPTAQATRNESACTAEARIRARLSKFNKALKKKHGFVQKNNRLPSELAPGIPKTGNLVDDIVLPSLGTFFRPGGFKNGLAGPASTREKLTRISSKNYCRDAQKSSYIYVWAAPAFPSPRCLVALLSFGLPFGVVGRSSRY